MSSIEGTPTPGEKDSVILLVDAPAGKGVFLEDDTPLKPVESSRTLKAYVIPVGGSEPGESTPCGGREWSYLVDFRTRVDGKWRSLHAFVVVHICSERRSLEVLDAKGDILLGWNLVRRKREPEKTMKIPEALLN